MSGIIGSLRQDRLHAIASVSCLTHTRSLATFGSSPAGPWSKGGHLIVVTRSSTESLLRPGKPRSIHLAFFLHLLVFLFSSTTTTTHFLRPSKASHDDHHPSCDDDHHLLPWLPVILTTVFFELHVVMMWKKENKSLNSERTWATRVGRHRVLNL